MAMLFGPAGNSRSFYEQGHKSSLDAPKWLRQLGLGAYEYQCVRGVNIGERTAAHLGAAAARENITLSIHAPYYINLASENREQVVKSKEHLLKSLRAARWMDARRVVFHTGSAGNDREAAMERAKKALTEVLEEAADEGLDDIILAPETLGKYSYIGLLDEVLELCTLGPNLFPCVDFGHVHAIDQGVLTDRAAFAKVLDRIEERMGREVLRRLHIHFSPVEYGKTGEKRHRTVEEGYGPDFTPLAELVVERDLEPVLICESNGTQAEDAVYYQSIYRKIKDKASI
ncbi:MAG: TIM barrel protein [Peptococcaceae bacterium]|nr:TIM barrel protein [Peptococcaceae bacterium]